MENSDVKIQTNPHDPRSSVPGYESHDPAVWWSNSWLKLYQSHRCGGAKRGCQAGQSKIQRLGCARGPWPTRSLLPVNLAVAAFEVGLDIGPGRGRTRDARAGQVTQKRQEPGHVKAVLEPVGARPEAYAAQHRLDSCLGHHDAFRARLFFQQVMAHEPVVMPGADAQKALGQIRKAGALRGLLYVVEPMPQGPATGVEQRCDGGFPVR